MSVGKCPALLWTTWELLYTVPEGRGGVRNQTAGINSRRCFNSKGAHLEFKEEMGKSCTMCVLVLRQFVSELFNCLIVNMVQLGKTSLQLGSSLKSEAKLTIGCFLSSSSPNNVVPGVFRINRVNQTFNWPRRSGQNRQNTTGWGLNCILYSPSATSSFQKTLVSHFLHKPTKCARKDAQP